MNYAIELELGAMIYIQSFINIGAGIQELIMGDTHRDTDTHTDRKVIS
jgi:tetrahydrodipicolinate N-succinyltransferase